MMVDMFPVEIENESGDEDDEDDDNVTLAALKGKK